MNDSSSPEFSRVYRLTHIRQQPLEVVLEANAEERSALVDRFGLASLASLRASLKLAPIGELVLADGELKARVQQYCVATGEPIETILDEPIALVFAQESEALEDSGGEDDDKRESCDDLQERDVVHFEGGSIDVGEAVAQTLLLSLNPYPRSAGADEFLKHKGVISEAEAGPFGALSVLRDKLGKQ